MTKFRIRKDNPSGKKEASVTLINGQKVKVNDTNWSEVDTSDYNHSSMNPNFFEVEGEPEIENKPDKAKKKK